MHDWYSVPFHLDLPSLFTDTTRETLNIQVRLVGGQNESEGRVEVSQDGQTWGTICDDYWGIEDANVVCRQLGYDYAIEALSYAYFGEGTGPIFMDDVNGYGSEESIGECYFLGWNQNNCVHREDAGVKCYGRTHLRVSCKQCLMILRQQFL